MADAPKAKATALLVAGRRPGTDPLAAHFGVDDKALIEVAGEPMLSRVARVLADDPHVLEVVVLAQDPAALMRHPRTAWMTADPRITSQAGGNSVSGAVAAAIAARPESWPFLVTAADNVLVDPATLAAFAAGAVASGGDVALGLVPRSVFLAQFPGARRTWLRFRGEAYSGANLFWLARPAALAAVNFWQRVEVKRKRVRAIAAAFGPGLLVAYLLRLLSAADAIGRAGRKLGVRAVPVDLPSAFACIDVDKPEDHALAEAILIGR
jgi:GTP:adenosylcobinamide-phosphate guanylyltransferase